MLREGTSLFDEYRDCSLRETERALFLAVSLYRRSLDLMITSAISWSHVTLYYGSFYTASALLRAFGGWVVNPSAVIDVSVSSPGGQELGIRRNVQSTYRGSHQRFWDFFYTAMTSLIPWIDPSLRLGVTPISNVRTWQIENRNKINYDTYEACGLMTNFNKSFRKSRFHASLPGALKTQFTVFQALLVITCDFVKQFGLKTDALDAIGSINRRAKIRELIFDEKAPELSKVIKKRRIII
jgi:hypothetical protein